MKLFIGCLHSFVREYCNVNKAFHSSSVTPSGTTLSIQTSFVQIDNRHRAVYIWHSTFFTTQLLTLFQYWFQLTISILNSTLKCYKHWYNTAFHNCCVYIWALGYIYGQNWAPPFHFSTIYFGLWLSSFLELS